MVDVLHESSLAAAPQPPLVCAFDQTTHASVADLHSYLRRWKIKQSIYYEEYHPRKDRLTGEVIRFKDYDQYWSDEFTSKENLKKWVTQYPKDGLEWAENWLWRRRGEKNLKYAPTQAELRTLMCPSMAFFDAVSDVGYYGITKAMGFEDRFNAQPLTFCAFRGDGRFIEDSREQEPLDLRAPTVRRKLEVGDYAWEVPGVDRSTTVIERKSLIDFCGTLTDRQIERVGKTKTTVDSPLARFRRELDRACDAGLYVVLMVESSITRAQRLDQLPETRHVKASASYLFHNLRDLLVEYPLNLQALFVENRDEMVRVIPRIFSLRDQARTVDLQYRYEKGEL